MLDWISDKILTAVRWVPGWLVEESSPTFFVVRAMFALMLVVFIFYLIAMWPSRDSIARHVGRMINVFSRRR
jgi:hypothetical protein